MQNTDFLIIIVLIIVFSIWVLIVKYFLYPLFFKPKLNSNETFDFLEKEKLVFVDKRELRKTEKKLNPFNYKKRFSLKGLYSFRSEYVIIGFSYNKEMYRFFWLELTQWYLFHLKFFIEVITEQKLGKNRSLVFKEIVENEIITDLKNIYEMKAVTIKDNCPACQYTISDKITECPNCGLNLGV